MLETQNLCLYKTIANLPPVSEISSKNLEYNEALLLPIVTSIQDGTAMLISDSLFYPDTMMATFMLILEMGDHRHQIKARQFILGLLSQNDAYRAEATGVVAGTSLLVSLTQCFGIKSGSVIQGCDGKSTLEKATNKWEIGLNDAHHDILQLNMDLTQQLRNTIIIHPQYVEGHADNHCNFNKLTCPQQLNIFCDAGAKELGRTPMLLFHLTLVINPYRWTLHN